MPLTKECICDRTNSNTAEFMIIGSRIELRCRKCNGVIRWWNEDNKKNIPLRRAWSDEECSTMR
jgi:hypothetical protein